MSARNPPYYLSPGQQDLLMTALNSNQSPQQQNRSNSDPQGLNNNRSSSSLYQSPVQQTPGSGQLSFDADDSPYLEFDGEFDDNYDYDINGEQMIGDLPGSVSPDEENDLHDKRKSIDGKDDDDEGGGKRREGGDKAAKKPGRKPLMSEPTSKRKAQNRAAQRAFRDRKEKHLKDLEVKVEGLEKESETTTHENGLLRAQVERLQVELKEYRKRLSWVSNSSLPRNAGMATQAAATAKTNSGANGNDFQFEFPKFGDLPGAHLFGNDGSMAKAEQTSNPNRSSSLPSASKPSVPAQKSNSVASGSRVPHTEKSNGVSPTKQMTASPVSQPLPAQSKSQNFDSFSALFSPSTLEASRNFEYFPQTAQSTVRNSRPGTENVNAASVNQPALYSNSSASNTDSPSSSTDSQRPASSIGTSPEPSLSSPSNAKSNDFGLNTINEENQSVQNISFPTSDITYGNDFNWLAQQNGGSFDPILFGDYREPQEAIVSQDFGSFFNDAFPLPDLGSPLHNFNEVAASPALATTTATAPAKMDLMKQVNATQNGEEEDEQEGPVPVESTKMMTCNKIWDRLQSMEKFRNGEIDVDNLCSELRAKARCSEGGAVVEKKDLDKIMSSAK